MLWYLEPVKLLPKLVRLFYDNETLPHIQLRRVPRGQTVRKHHRKIKAFRRMKVVKKNKFFVVNKTIVIAYYKWIAQVFELHRQPKFLCNHLRCLRLPARSSANLQIFPAKTKPSVQSSSDVKRCRRRSLIGSLRINDFRTTTPLANVIVPCRRPIEIWIYDSAKTTTFIRGRQNFSAVSEICLSIHQVGYSNQNAELQRNESLFSLRLLKQIY